MNSKKKYIAITTAALSAVSFNAQAITAQVGLETCVDALVEELSASSGNEMGYQLDPGNTGFDSRLKSLESITMYARDPHSNELVSSMECVINKRGRIVRLTSLPLDGKEPGQFMTEVK